jgi:hypothetical protein
MRQAKERFQKWDETLQVPDTHQVGFGKHLEFDEDKDTWEEVGWRSYHAVARAEIVGDMIRDASASPDQSDGGFGRWQVNMEFTPLGANRFERSPATTSTALRDHPRRRGQERPGHPREDRRRQRRITMGAGRSDSAARRREEARAGAALRRAAGADLALERADHRPLARRDAIVQGREGRGRRRAARRRLMLLFYSEGRDDREHRGALQPGAPARGARDVQRLDDAARASPASRSRSASRSTPTCSSTSASARSCAPARRRAPPSRPATTRRSAPSSTATSRRSSPASSSRSTAPAPSRASPSR